MIFTAPPPNGVGFAAPIAAEYSLSSRVYETAAAGAAPSAPSLDAEEGDAAAFEPEVRDMVEQYDWENPKLNREFIRLEQKVLAKKADVDEHSRYQAMKRNRNSMIFADRYMRDYAEVQRLKMLSAKLAEIQQYLRPIDI